MNNAEADGLTRWVSKMVQVWGLGLGLKPPGEPSHDGGRRYLFIRLALHV